MRRGRHRLKSRASQEQARRMRVLHQRYAATRSVLAAFADFTDTFIEALGGVVTGIDRFAESLEASMWRSPVWAWRDELEGDFSGFEGPPADSGWTGLDADAIFGEAGSGHRVYGGRRGGWAEAIRNVGEPNIIDVDGHVVDPDPAPSALEVYRGR